MFNELKNIIQEQVLKYNDDSQKLSSPNGLCTNVMKTDEENADRMVSIIRYYLQGGTMERTRRESEEWIAVESLPMNFADFRYRILR